MLLSKAVATVFFLVAVINVIRAIPRPSSITRERHIIRTPIKYRTIHHYKVKKVPVIIKKHVHYYKPHNNHVSNDDGDEFEFHREENRPKFKSIKPSFPRNNHNQEEEEEEEYEEPEQSPEEEEYEEPQQSPEEEYNNYEYE